MTAHYPVHDTPADEVLEAVEGTPQHQLLEAAEGDVGPLVDLANWTGPDRDAQLASIGGIAETSHAKCTTKADGSLDTDDFRRALMAVTASGFAGLLCLVYDAPDPDEWEGLATCRRVTADLPS